MAVITTIRSAFGFLTRLPVGPWPLQNDLNGISAWLPLVGLVVGGLAGGLTWAATLLFPSLVCGVIGCACWVAITGGLHLDGVADCGDGLPVEVPRERRLEIMKDSRLGTFGGYQVVDGARPLLEGFPHAAGARARKAHGDEDLAAGQQPGQRARREQQLP